ncbi:sodium:solute symporter family protein [Maledivibacter halophilus]|uniref:Solute:Na+ symporter, SSS family n=1 Tax=Maledivibacter halophilus TaxID=36842 RepID=A0A1T5IC63_9FIRM|nr:sodium:solute symporter family protein [Maledivibacter halophilus]SKC36774.1 solute:Na+ symporter, SSS family [Maledivibacter halophilus]
MNIGLIILILYTISLLGIAYYASKQDKKNISDFATASSSLGIFVLTLTFSATYHSSYAFLGAPGFVYANGIGWWVNGIWTVFPGILFWILGRRFWFLGKKYGYISMAQYISDVYQDHMIGLLVTIITLIFTIPYVAMQAIGSGYIFEVISEGKLSYEFGTIIFFGLMIILVWLGGMKGIAITDAAQGVFMWIGMVIGSYWIIKVNFGSISNAYVEAMKILPEHFTLPGPKGVVTSGDWISRWTVITIGMMMFPHITLRFFSGKSLRVLKWSSVFSSIYLTSIFIFTPAIGFAGNIIFPNIASPDIIFPEMLLKYTPLVFSSLVIAGALAASMSTGNSQLHAVSSMVSTDVYKKYIDKSANAYKQYTVAKVATLIFGVFSVVVALQRPGLLGNILALSNGGVAALAPAMIGGIYWKKATREGALWSIIFGEIAMLLTTFVVPSPLGIMPGLWGLIVSFMVYILICNITKTNERTIEIIDSINDFFYSGAKV